MRILFRGSLFFTKRFRGQSYVVLTLHEGTLSLRALRALLSLQKHGTSGFRGLDQGSCPQGWECQMSRNF